MAGTVEGGRAAAVSNKKWHGEDFYRRIGSIGGRKGKKDGTIKGFAANREMARIAGAKGGRISRKPRRLDYEGTTDHADVTDSRA